MSNEELDEESEGLRALEENLDALLPACTVVDRRLDIEEGPCVDLVCTDDEGRLHLVMFVEGGAQESVLSALDTVSFLKRYTHVIARHVGGNANADLRPRLILVAEHFAQRAANRLAPLLEECDGIISLFEVRSLSSDRGDALWFAPVEPGHHEGGAPRLSFDSFIEALGDEKRGLARAFERDLRRADPETSSDAKRDRVTWWLGETELCTLRNVHGALMLEVAGQDPVELESVADRVAALEGVMELVLRQVGEMPEEETPHDPIVMAEPAALLTDEELDAFREF